MKKSVKIKLSEKIIYLLFFLLLVGCSDNNTIEKSDVTKDQNLTSFSKILASSLNEKPMREFIKSMAIKKVDGDYELIFHSIKNDELENGVKFIDALQKHNNTALSIEEITKDIPKLSILVPELLLARPEDWDIENTIPNVVVLTSDAREKTCKELKAFNYANQELKMDAHVEPTITTIVVGESDRVSLEGEEGSLCSSSCLPSSKYCINGRKFVVDGNGTSIMLVKNSLNKIPSLISTTTVSTSPRENYYYSSGDLNTNIKENLSYFKFLNRLAVQNASDNWTEGALEIRCNLVLGGTNSEAFSSLMIKKSISRYVAQVSIYNSAGEAMQGNSGNKGMGVIGFTYYGLFIENGSLVNINGKTWIPFMGETVNWSPHRYGDVIKLIFSEYDNGATTTKEYSSEVGFSSSYGKKDVWNIGLNGKVTGKTTIVSTDKSEELGESFVYYTDNYGTSYPRSTGDFAYVFEPILK